MFKAMWCWPEAGSWTTKVFRWMYDFGDSHWYDQQLHGGRQCSLMILLISCTRVDFGKPLCYHKEWFVWKPRATVNAIIILKTLLSRDHRLMIWLSHNNKACYLVIQSSFMSLFLENEWQVSWNNEIIHRKEKIFALSRAQDNYVESKYGCHLNTLDFSLQDHCHSCRGGFITPLMMITDELFVITVSTWISCHSCQEDTIS